MVGQMRGDPQTQQLRRRRDDCLLACQQEVFPAEWGGTTLLIGKWENRRSESAMAPTKVEKAKLGGHPLRSKVAPCLQHNVCVALPQQEGFHPEGQLRTRAWIPKK